MLLNVNSNIFIISLFGKIATKKTPHLIGAARGVHLFFKADDAVNGKARQLDFNFVF